MASGLPLLTALVASPKSPPALPRMASSPPPLPLTLAASLPEAAEHLAEDLA